MDVVNFRSKRDSRLMRLIGWFWPAFMTRFWTTIGYTIYYPVQVKDPHEWRYRYIVRHEWVHIKQAQRFTRVGHSLLYLLFPVPFLFAWYRWWAEREAYMVQLTSKVYSVDMVVDTLWRNYGWCWPRPLMRRWFKRRLAEES